MIAWALMLSAAIALIRAWAAVNRWLDRRQVKP